MNYSERRRNYHTEQCKSAREHFKDFVADFKDYGDLQTLDWRNKDGSSNYHVHYIFDTKQRYLHISGDLGSAAFYLSWEPTFENVTSTKDINYLARKIECTTDKWVYSEELASEEIDEYMEDIKPERDDFEDESEYLSEKEDFEDYVEKLKESFDYHRGLVVDDADLMEWMEHTFDFEFYEQNFGRVLAPRIYLWFMGLELAWEQIQKTK